MNLWDVLFPKRCVGCGGFGAYLCMDCLGRVKETEEPICPMCEKPSISGMAHARCRRAWGMAGLVSAVSYRGVVKRLVGAYKYRYVREMTGILVELIETYVDVEAIGHEAWVVPVPLHPRRERWRGFNQAVLLGKGIAEYFGWEYAGGVLERTKYTKPQMTLSGKARREALAGAFGRGKEIEAVAGKRVVLVDDVWTTGATMRECAKVLRRAGAAEVWGLTLSRA